MIDTIIVDDEKNSRELLSSFLKEYCSDINIVGKAKNVEEGHSLINEKKPKLIFLDIELSGGSGFDILDNIKATNVLTCFVTGYSEYAIKAIKYGAFDYILKPLDKEELVNVVKKAKKHLNNGENAKSSIVLYEGQKIIHIECADIEHIEVDGNYCIIHHKDKRKTLSGENLKHFNSILPEDEFSRIHKSYIIKLSEIKELEMKRTGLVTLKSGKTLPIASRRKKEFIKKLMEFMKENDTFINF